MASKGYKWPIVISVLSGHYALPMTTQNDRQHLNSYSRLVITIAISRLVFTARRYASAVYAVVVRVSVRPSVCPSVRHTPVLYQKG